MKEPQKSKIIALLMDYSAGVYQNKEMVDIIESILSPLPHQDGASADTNYITQFKIGQKVKDDVRGYGEGVVTDSDGQWILVRFKGCYQNYTSCGRWKRDHVITLHPIEVEKAVADGASAEDVVTIVQINESFAEAERCLLRIDVFGENVLVERLYTELKWLRNELIKYTAMHQFAKSETAKVVAEKDREIAKWKQSYHTSERHRLEDAASAIDDQNMQFERHKNHVALLQSDLTASNAHRTRLIEAIRKWIKSWRKDQQEIRRIKSELSKANERIKELEKVLGKSPVKEIADEPRDKNGQTFDQWAEDNGCY